MKKLKKLIHWSRCFAAVISRLLVLRAADAIHILATGHRSDHVRRAAVAVVIGATDRLYAEEYGA